MNRHNGSTTTKVSPSSPMNRTTKIWFTSHYRNPSRRNPEPLQQRSGAQPTTGLGAPEQLQVTTQGSQPPHGRLGSKNPRVTSSQAFNILVESTNRCNEAMARAQVLKSFTLKSHHKQLMLMGEKRGRTKKNSTNGTPRSRSKGFPSLRGEMDWWNNRSRSPLSFPTKWRQESCRD